MTFGAGRPHTEQTGAASPSDNSTTRGQAGQSLSASPFALSSCPTRVRSVIGIPLFRWAFFQRPDTFFEFSRFAGLHANFEKRPGGPQTDGQTFASQQPSERAGGFAHAVG